MHSHKKTKKKTLETRQLYFVKVPVNICFAVTVWSINKIQEVIYIANKRVTCKCGSINSVMQNLLSIFYPWKWRFIT